MSVLDQVCCKRGMLSRVGGWGSRLARYRALGVSGDSGILAVYACWRTQHIYICIYIYNIVGIRLKLARPV